MSERFVVVKDSCAAPRYEVWDSVAESVVAVFADPADAEADKDERNGAAGE